MESELFVMYESRRDSMGHGFATTPRCAATSLWSVVGTHEAKK